MNHIRVTHLVIGSSTSLLSPAAVHITYKKAEYVVHVCACVCVIGFPEKILYAIHLM